MVDPDGCGIAHSKSSSGKIDDMYCAAHGQQKVYPTLGDGSLVSTHADAWVLGDAVTVIPANTISQPFSIHNVTVCDVSGQDHYQIEIYYDGCALQATFSKTALSDPNVALTVRCPIIQANSAVTVKMANKAAAQVRTARVKLWYNEH